MNYWIITDTHFGHQNCEEWCDRPKGFESKIIKSLRTFVKEDDVLIHLGDFIWKNAGIWNDEFHKIKCKKWLVMGNHDKQSKTWFLNNGWDFLADSFRISIFGTDITFSHMPIIDFKGGLNIHGHFHNVPRERINKKEPQFINCFTDKYYLVCLEDLNYAPISLKKIIQNVVRKEKRRNWDND